MVCWPAECPCVCLCVLILATVKNYLLSGIHSQHVLLGGIGGCIASVKV